MSSSQMTIRLPILSTCPAKPLKGWWAGRGQQVLPRYARRLTNSLQTRTGKQGHLISTVSLPTPLGVIGAISGLGRRTLGVRAVGGLGWQASLISTGTKLRQWASCWKS